MVLTSEEIKQEAIDAATCGRLDYLKTLLGLPPLIAVSTRHSRRYYTQFHTILTGQKAILLVIDNLIKYANLPNTFLNELLWKKHIKEHLEKELSEKYRPEEIFSLASAGVSNHTNSIFLMSENFSKPVVVEVSMPKNVSLALSVDPQMWDQIKKDYKDHHIELALRHLHEMAVNKDRAWVGKRELLKKLSEYRERICRNIKNAEKEIETATQGIASYTQVAKAAYRENLEKYLKPLIFNPDMEPILYEGTQLKKMKGTELNLKEAYSPLLREKCRQEAQGRRRQGFKIHALSGETEFCSELFSQFLKMKSYLDINTINEQGHTLLRIAVENDNPDIVDYLLKGGAELHFPDEKGLTPAQRATERGNKAIIGLFAEQEKLRIEEPITHEIAWYYEQTSVLKRKFPVLVQSAASSYIQAKTEEEQKLWGRLLSAIFDNKANIREQLQIAQAIINAAQKALLSEDDEQLYNIVKEKRAGLSSALSGPIGGALERYEQEEGFGLHSKQLKSLQTQMQTFSLQDNGRKDDMDRREAVFSEQLRAERQMKTELGEKLKVTTAELVKEKVEREAERTMLEGKVAAFAAEAESERSGRATDKAAWELKHEALEQTVKDQKAMLNREVKERKDQEAKLNQEIKERKDQEAKLNREIKERKDQEARLRKLEEILVQGEKTKSSPPLCNKQEDTSPPVVLNPAESAPTKLLFLSNACVKQLPRDVAPWWLNKKPSLRPEEADLPYHLPRMDWGL